MGPLEIDVKNENHDMVIIDTDKSIPVCPTCGAECRNDIEFMRVAKAYGMEKFRLFCTNGHSNYLPPPSPISNGRRVRHIHYKKAKMT